jgi:hypothetical protein
MGLVKFENWDSVTPPAVAASWTTDAASRFIRRLLRHVKY